VDEFTRECLAIEVAHSIPSLRVVEVLERLREERGLPAVLISDNGSEITKGVTSPLRIAPPRPAVQPRTGSSPTFQRECEAMRPFRHSPQ